MYCNESMFSVKPAKLSNLLSRKWSALRHFNSPRSSNFVIMLAAFKFKSYLKSFIFLYI